MNIPYLGSVMTTTTSGKKSAFSRGYAGIVDEEIIFGLALDNLKPLMEAFENI